MNRKKRPHSGGGRRQGYFEKSSVKNLKGSGSDQTKAAVMNVWGEGKAPKEKSREIKGNPTKEERGTAAAKSF